MVHFLPPCRSVQQRPAPSVACLRVLLAIAVSRVPSRLHPVDPSCICARSEHCCWQDCGDALQQPSGSVPMHDVLDGDGSFLGNALGEEITDFDVEAILGDIMAPANIMEDPSRTDLEVLTPATVGARSALHAAQKFSEGSDIDLESLVATLSDLNIVKSTSAANGWAQRKYEFVRRHRATNLPEDPWTIALEFARLRPERRTCRSRC